MIYLNRFLLTFITLYHTANLYASTDAFYELINNNHHDQAIQLIKNDPDNYLNILIKQAVEKELYNHKKWHMLVHYKKNIFGSFTSEVDEKKFFASESGKHNPRAELEATLASFFSDHIDPDLKLAPQCHFIARFYWLNQQLSFDPKKLPIQQCQKFLDFKKGVDTENLTMIFPSAHPNGPASMFGHTSLKLDKKGHSSKSRMLDYTLNYAAMAGPERGVSYAIRGLTGSFRGQYSILPYYKKIREYAQMESRDIWEYTLNLTQQQVDFIIMHAYELSSAYYDYYFFTENCSYHLMTLIESSMDSPLLSDSFNGWVIPVDTLKALDENNLIKSIQYQPSLSTTINHRRKLLSETENRLVYKILENGFEENKGQLNELPKNKQAIILDLLYEYMRYIKIDNSKKLETSITEKERSVLLARSKLGIPSRDLNIPEPSIRPDQGHDTSRLTLANINPNDKQSFQRISWRAAYHGLLDPSPGYSPNYQLEFFNLQLSNEESDDSIQFDNLEILNIISLVPRDGLFKNISWSFKTGIDRIVREPNLADTIYYLDAGFGLTYKKNWFNDTYLYGFADIEFDVGDNRYNKVLVSLGPKIGILSNLNDIWKVHLQAYSFKKNDTMRNLFHEISLGQSISISKNISLNIEAKRWITNNRDIENDSLTISLNLFH